MSNGGFDMAIGVWTGGAGHAVRACLKKTSWANSLGQLIQKRRNSDFIPFFSFKGL